MRSNALGHGDYILRSEQGRIYPASCQRSDIPTFPNALCTCIVSLTALDPQARDATMTTCQRSLFLLPFVSLENLRYTLLSLFNRRIYVPMYTLSK